MRHKKLGLGLALLVLLLSAVLGATVLREPIAYAASSTPFQNVIVMNSDTQPVPVKQVGGVTASTSDVDQRTAKRFGPKTFGTFAGDPVLLIAQDGIPAGQKFIVSYVGIEGSSAISGFPLADGRCTMFVVRTQDDRPQQFLVGGIPMHIGDGRLAGSETAFLPVNSGEGLEFFCSGRTAAGERPSSFFSISVSGYFMPAS